MRRWLLRMTLALVTFSIGVTTSRLTDSVRNRAVKNPGTNSKAAQLPTPTVVPTRRTWPEPQALDLGLVDTDKLAYESYLVQRLYKTAKLNDLSAPEQARVVDVDVSYAILARN